MIGERGRHALAFHTRNLEAERDDQCRVHGGGEEGLEPRDEFVPPHAQSLRQRVRGRVLDLEVQGSGMRVDAGLDRDDNGFEDRRGAARLDRLGYSFKYSRSRLV